MSRPKSKMKHVLAMSMMAGLAASPAFASSELTSGVWARGDGAAKIRISPCGEALCAINIWIRNPGSEKVGDRLVLNVRPTAPGVFEGSAYDPQRNLHLTSRITLNGNRMTTNGCVLGGILCRSVSWTRQ